VEGAYPERDCIEIEGKAAGETSPLRHPRLRERKPRRWQRPVFSPDLATVPSEELWYDNQASLGGIEEGCQPASPCRWKPVRRRS